MQTKLEIKAARLLSIDARRKAHNAALSRLHRLSPPLPPANAAIVPNPLQEAHETRGLKMWRKLRRLETEAHDAATAQCNGERYQSQPFRSDLEMRAFKLTVRSQIITVFGGTLPKGFFVNGDPRGYALKLDPDKTTIPEGMETDWGRNGILAAEIND